MEDAVPGRCKVTIKADALQGSRGRSPEKSQMHIYVPEELEMQHRTQERDHGSGSRPKAMSLAPVLMR